MSKFFGSREFFATLFLVLILYSVTNLVFDLSSFVVSRVKGEAWQCVEWVTPCGVVTTEFLAVNGSDIDWSIVGCPVTGCRREVLTRTFVDDVEITASPNLPNLG